MIAKIPFRCFCTHFHGKRFPCWYLWRHKWLSWVLNGWNHWLSARYSFWIGNNWFPLIWLYLWNWWNWLHFQWCGSCFWMNKLFWWLSWLHKACSTVSISWFSFWWADWIHHNWISLWCWCLFWNGKLVDRFPSLSCIWCFHCLNLLWNLKCWVHLIKQTIYLFRRDRLPRYCFIIDVQRWLYTLSYIWHSLYLIRNWWFKHAFPLIQITNWFCVIRYLFLIPQFFNNNLASWNIRSTWFSWWFSVFTSCNSVI